MSENDWPRHGEWSVKIFDSCKHSYRMFQCSSCSRLRDVKTPYCPNCGAKMEKGGTYYEPFHP